MGTERGCWVPELSSFSSSWDSRSKTGIQEYRVRKHEVMGGRQSCSPHELHLALSLPRYRQVCLLKLSRQGGGQSQTLYVQGSMA